MADDAQALADPGWPGQQPDDSVVHAFVQRPAVETDPDRHSAAVRLDERLGEALVAKIISDPIDRAAGGHSVDPLFEQVAKGARLLIRSAEECL